ncbi:hypothetical protein RB623_18770 [Mesorhizobium sp. LHD-90]|uniref:hypothetical protein n=1 Tax=Mesorhizobium sp. LHD-90 TaxID=3071414 RepID=UPI0027DFE213|nr:hypothetical protein [Mesorhizobium sp. LHD-90]MDQ6436105.1 hypothetical protein [Mesorhizobium sp. LHD-90]
MARIKRHDNLLLRFCIASQQEHFRVKIQDSLVPVAALRLTVLPDISLDSRQGNRTWALGASPTAKR